MSVSNSSSLGKSSTSSSSSSKFSNVPEGDFIIGYKGFKKMLDGSLRCRDQVYNLKETYVLCQQPQVCSVGFHFCRKLEQVFEFYPNSEPDHVYYKVAGWGKVHEDHNKVAVDHIQVIEKVSDNDMLIIKLRPHMALVDAVMEDNENAIISGSLALILQGLMPYREIHDLDITAPFFGGFKTASVDSRFGESGKDTIQMSLTSNGRNIGFDLFINPTIIYTTINFEGKTYKVCDFKPIVEAKFRYLMGGTMKHSDDIIHIITRLKAKSGYVSNTKKSDDFIERKGHDNANARQLLNNPNSFGKKVYRMDEEKKPVRPAVPVASSSTNVVSSDDDYPF